MALKFLNRGNFRTLSNGKLIRLEGLGFAGVKMRWRGVGGGGPARFGGGYKGESKGVLEGPKRPEAGSASANIGKSPHYSPKP